MFHAQATTEIVGDWEEHGLDTMRRYSLAFWAEAEVTERAEPAVVEGREVVLVYARDAAGTERLSSMIALDLADGVVTRQRWYYFCTELLGHAGDALGVAALNHGYRYEPADAQAPANAGGSATELAPR